MINNEVQKASEDLFTGREKQLTFFQNLLSSKPGAKIWMLYGPGGRGKSWLLSQFANICQDDNYVAVTISGDDKSYNRISFLKELRDQLASKEDFKASFSGFDELIRKLLKIKKGDLQSRKSEKQQKESKNLGVQGAKGALSEVAGAGVGSFLAGPVGAILGGMTGGILGALVERPITNNIEKLKQKLIKRGYSKGEVEFLLEFDDKICKSFANTINIIDQKTPVVLMIDGYDQLKNLDYWIRKFWLPKMESIEVLIIIAGQTPLDKRKWQRWESVLTEEELEAFTKGEAIKYWKKRGIEDPTLFEEGYNITKGLPLGVARWAEIQSETEDVNRNIDFSELETKLTAFITDWLFDSTSKKQLKKVIRVCSIPRWFNLDTLKILLEKENVEEVFEKLHQHSDFFRVHEKGLAMHEDIRKPIVLDLQRRSPETFHKTNKKILSYFEEKLSEIERNFGKFSSDWQELRLETLYHKFQKREIIGIKALVNMVREVRTDPVFLETLITDISSYISNPKVKNWLNLFRGILTYDKGKWNKAKETFQQLLDKSDLKDAHLKTLVLTNLGIIYYYQGQMGEAIKCYKEIIELKEQLRDEVLLAYSMVNLGGEIFRDQGEWEELMDLFKRGIDIFYRHKENYARARTLLELGNLYRLRGDWKHALELSQKAFTLFESTQNQYDSGRALYTIGRIFMQKGNFKKAKEKHTQSLQILGNSENLYGVGMALRNLADVYRKQGHFKKSLNHYMESLEIFKDLDAVVEFARVLGDLGTLHAQKNIDSLALYYYDRCLGLKRQRDDKYGIGYTKYYLGLFFLRRGSWDKAYVLLRRSLEIMKEYGNLHRQGQNLVALAKLSLATKNRRGELSDYLEKGGDIAESENFHDQMAELAYLKGVLLLREQKYIDAYVKLNEAYTYTLSHNLVRYTKYMVSQLIKTLEELKEISQGHALQLCRCLSSFNAKRDSSISEKYNNILQKEESELIQSRKTLAKQNPELFGILENVDCMIKEAIDQKVFPGAAIWIGWKGKTLKSSAYGHFSYDKSSPVNTDTLYDLASLTKVIVTTTAIMQLSESCRVELDAKVANYIPSFANGDKKNITIRHILTHTSGLPAHVKLYEQSQDKQEIISEICQLSLEFSPGDSYQYCDVGYIILGEIVDKITGLELDQYARKNIFDPLEMNHTTFNPSEDFKGKIAPTENVEWRGGRVQGEVHDENAWAMGGISGHAGLFSSLDDLATFCEMLLNFGTHNHSQILESQTVIEMTDDQLSKAKKSCGLGWAIDEESFMGELASQHTFGHTGFTGTSIIGRLVDGLGVIFLTNRVCPSRNGKNINPYRNKIASSIAKVL